MKYTYLLINFFTVLIPLAWSFESKMSFYRKWKFLFPAIFITAMVFLIWDYFKTKYGVWGFNPNYIIGIKFGNLPVEEVLFFITVPYSCMFIYESASYYLNKYNLAIKTKLPIFLLSFLFFTLSFFAWGRVYTWSVLLFSSIMLPVLVYVLSQRQLSLFFISFLISLLPMLVVNGLLTAIPVVIYNDSQNLGIRLGTIPVEDFLYCFILLSLNISLYEFFRGRSLNTSGSS